MKKMMALAMAAAMTMAALTGCGGSSDSASGDVPVIGISQYGQHASLDNCREGFLLGLEESGLVAAAEDKNIPVIFTAITDPVKAKLDSGNISGTSDKLPIEEQLKLIRALQPDAKTIGILYTTSEPNSVSAVEEYQAKAPEFGFTIEAIGVMQQSEVLQAADTMISKGVDCMTNLTDNNVVGVLPSILEKTNDAGIPVYGSEIEQVKIGCVASAGIEYVALGKRTGEMAAKILKGEATAEEMPYETITDSEIYINPGVLETLGLTVPEDIAAEAIDVTAE